MFGEFDRFDQLHHMSHVLDNGLIDKEAFFKIRRITLAWSLAKSRHLKLVSSVGSSPLYVSLHYTFELIC